MKILLICLMLLSTPFAFSHEPKQNSAQVYLRDGQVELRLFVNRDKWINRLTNAQSWLLGDSDIVLTQEDVQSSDLNDRLLGVLEKNVMLKLNKQSLQLKGIQQSKNASSHHRMEFRLSAIHTLSDPDTLNLSFPKSIGTVSVSVMKPQYGTIQAGEERTFLVE